MDLDPAEDRGALDDEHGCPGIPESDGTSVPPKIPTTSLRTVIPSGTVISRPPNMHTAVMTVSCEVSTASVRSSSPPPKMHSDDTSAGTVHAPLRSKPPKIATRELSPMPARLGSR